jgi:hypothetical protein
MSQRVIYSIRGHEKALAAFPHAVLGHYADGAVIALGDDAAVALMARAPAFALLFYSKEACDHALRQLSEEERDAAIRKRLTNWAPNAVYEGMAWLYRGERRCLALTARSLQSRQRTGIPEDHFEHSMVALHRLVNEGAHGNSTLASVLVFLMRREALLLLELPQPQAAGAPPQVAAEVAERKQLHAGVGQALAVLGRPEFAPYVEPERAALVSPADPALRATLKTRRQPVVEWRGGIVSIFAARDLEDMAQQRKSVRILYPDAGSFLKDFTELTPAQLSVQLAERLQAGPLPFWEDYLSFMRLDIALMRRAAHDKALAGNPGIAAQLAAQFPRESALLLEALARHPSWISEPDLPHQATVAQAETEVLEDARFMGRLSATAQYKDVQPRYLSFADFKARQRQRF